MNFDAHADGQTPDTLLNKIIYSVTAVASRRPTIKSIRMAQRSLIDQSLLEKLERLTLHWQKSFPGLVGGRNASRFSGPGPGVPGSPPLSSWRRFSGRQLARLSAVRKAAPEVVPGRAANPCSATARHQRIHGNRARPNSTTRRKLAAAHDLCWTGAARYESVSRRFRHHCRVL